MKKIIFIGMAIIGLALLGMGLSVVQMMPDDALLFVNDEKKVYYAPPYLLDYPEAVPDGVIKLRLTTAFEAHHLKYSPDPDCRDKGYFMQDAGTFLGKTLRDLGVLPPLPSRWNKDGTWNW